MTDQPIQPIQPGRVSPEPSRPASGPGSGARFEVLLERLQDRATQLRGESERLSESQDLSGAVDASRRSLEDAKALHAELLEAFRARLQGENS